MNEISIQKPEVKLSPKEALFLKLYTDPKSKTFGNQTQTALIVWPNQKYSSASTTAVKTLEKANIKLTDLMDRKGLSDGKLLDKFAEWIDAKKIKSSMTEPDKIVEDYQTQLKAGEMIMKIKGLDRVNDTQTSNNQVNVQINLGDSL